MKCKGYIYVTTYIPTGVKYFGSRKLKEGVTPETDSYRGSPADTNLMHKLFETKPTEEFSKEILFEGDYEEVLELENLVIEAAWEKWGIVSEGGLVTNLVAIWGRPVVVTEEVRIKLSNAGKGRVLSEETKDKQRNYAKGKVKSEETCAKLSALASLRTGANSTAGKAVINTATGQVWPSVTEAAHSEGIGQTAMTNRIRKGSNGGIWQYA